MIRWGQSWTTRSLSKLFTKKSARKKKFFFFHFLENTTRFAFAFELEVNMACITNYQPTHLVLKVGWSKSDFDQILFLRLPSTLRCQRDCSCEQVGNIFNDMGNDIVIVPIISTMITTTFMITSADLAENMVIIILIIYVRVSLYVQYYLKFVCTNH